MNPPSVYRPGELSTLPPQGRLYCWSIPLLLIIYGLLCIPIAIYDVAVNQRRPFDLFCYRKWSDDVFGKVWKFMNSAEEQMHLEEKRRVAAGCEGVVIEIGPGLGSNLKHLRKEKITHVYGIEPNLRFYDVLRQNIEKFGWGGKYTIVPCGIEETEELKKYGVPSEGVDSVFCIQTLCSVPNPQKILREIYEVLKPGGELRLFEHVQSQEPSTKRLQRLYDYVWHLLFGNCNLSRPTTLWLQDREVMGFGDDEGWEIVEVDKIKGASKWECLPNVWGRLVKKR